METVYKSNNGSMSRIFNTIRECALYEAAATIEEAYVELHGDEYHYSDLIEFCSHHPVAMGYLNNMTTANVKDQDFYHLLELFHMALKDSIKALKERG